MSVVSSEPTASSAPAAKMPGEVVRGLVSLWLIVHFLGILLAVVTQNEYAGGPGPGEFDRSQLLHRLKQVPPIDQYIFALWLDVPYSYYLANNGPFDGDLSLRFDLIDADGKRLDPIIWPADDIHFGERRERLAKLAYTTAFNADRGNPALVAAIGKTILTQTGAKDMELSIWRRQPLSLEDARSTDPALSDPKNPRTMVRIYVAKVRLSMSGEAQVSVPQEARDVAAPNRPDSSSAAPQDGKSGANESTEASGSEEKSAPNAPRQKSRRQQADPLPQPERQRPAPNLPPSLFRPSEPSPDSKTPAQ